MDNRGRSWQWSLSVVVYHGPGFGHALEIITQRKGQVPTYQDAGTWNGLGVPEAVLTSLNTALCALATDHLATRYGIKGELPTTWAGEPDPF